MKRICNISNLLILWTVIFWLATTTTAQDLKVLAAPTPFNLMNSDGSENKTIEPSAVALIGNGKFLLVADDKDDDAGNSLKIVDAATGKVLKLITKVRLQPSPKEPKWEALAKDDQNNYYVSGSHNNKDADKLANRSFMFRFKLENESEQDAQKIEIKVGSKQELDIKESLTALKLYNAEPSDNKVKIEGLAVRNNGCQQELIIGFREPFDTVKVYSAIVPNNNAVNNLPIKLSLKPFFHFNAGNTADGTQFQLSSIEYVPDLKGFLVMTSTETTDPTTQKPVFHGNALWFVRDEMIEVARPAEFSESYKPVAAQKVLDFQLTLKAEGICLLSRKDQQTFRFIIVFDNDAKDTKIGGKMQFLELSTTQN